jgi:tetratricopeptide (TPR) repeat protein
MTDQFIIESLTNLLVNWYRVERRWEVIPLVSWVEWFGYEMPESNGLIGKLLYLLGYFNNAHRYLNRSVSLYQNELVHDAHKLIVTLSDFAVLLREMGQLEPSLLKIDQALELLAIYGERHTAILAKLQSDRGRTLELLGCTDQAEDWYGQALNACESIEDDNNLYRSEILSNLAGLLHDKGSINQSIELYEQALQLCRNRLDENHPWVAELYNNLALSLYVSGNRSRAIELFELAISTGSSHLDPEYPYHPKLAISHSNIAQLLWDEGLLEDARDHLCCSIVMDEQCFGKQYAGLRQSYSMLADLLEELGEVVLADGLRCQ